MTSSDKDAVSGSYEEAVKFAELIKSRTKYRPKLGIVCGSGLGTLCEVVENQEVISYESLPGFPKSSVAGHQGNFVFGTLSGKCVVLMQGRFHPYEGLSTKTCCLPIRVMRLIGVDTIFLTNASGGLNDKFKVGDIMLIKDHINLPSMAGFSPFLGPNDERFGVRFPAVSDAYDRDLLKLAKKTAHELKFDDFLQEGIYFMQMGPAYETIAESKMVRMLGGDCVGMSTVHETLVARHSGMRVFAMSLITNKVILDYDVKEKANHEEVLATGKARANDMRTLISKMVASADFA